MEKPLINKKYLLEKFQGKGGWTYARIPDILPEKNSPFGWVRVRGTIDDFEIKNYHLMPMGNGKLFLPVKAGIRKKIGKAEGDYVHVVLYADDRPVEIPEELQLYLLDEPTAYKIFLAYTDGEKKPLSIGSIQLKKKKQKLNVLQRLSVLFKKGNDSMIKINQMEKKNASTYNL